MGNSKLVLIGIILLFSATFSSAYSLSEFPEPFVRLGVPAPNLAIIVGDGAAASDVLGAVDVALSLQTATAQFQEIRGRLRNSEQSMPVRTRARVVAVNDYLGNVREAFTELDSDLLKGGKIVTQQRATSYHQYLRFANNTGRIIFDRNTRGAVDAYLYFTSSEPIFEWQLQFDQGLVSRIDGGRLPDLHDKEMQILGQPMVIVDTDFSESTGRLMLKLLGGATAPIMAENDKQTYKVNGEDYYVEVIALSTTANNGEGSVKFRINGEITEEMSRGSVTTLSDGTHVGVRSILPSGKELQASVVQLYLGAHYLMFEDKNITDALNTTGGVTVNGKVVPTGALRIEGEVLVSNITMSIDSIRYSLIAEPLFGEVYIPPNSGLRDYLKTQEGMLVPDWDVYFNGLSKTGESKILLEPVSEQKYVLEFTNQENIHYEFPLLTAQNNCLRYGDENDDLWFVESNSPTTYYGTLGDFFVLSKCNPSSNKNTCNTRILKYKSADTSSLSVGALRLYFADLGTGEKDATLALSGGSYQGTLSAGDGEYAVRANSVMNLNGAPNISIDLNGDGAFTNGEAVVGIKGEGLIDLGATNTNESNAEGRDARVCTNPAVTLRTLSKEFEKSESDEVIPFTIEARSSDAIGVQTPITATAGYFSGLKFVKSRRQTGFSGYGALFEFYEPGAIRAETLTVHYPLMQRGADVSIGTQRPTLQIVEELGAEEETAQDAMQTVRQVQMSNIVRFASEIANIRDYNSILIGGACVNPIAAQLQGYPQPCWESIAKGVAIVYAYEFPTGNIALLVAGRSAQDTRRATTALATGMLKNIKGTQARVAQSAGKIDVLEI